MEKPKIIIEGKIYTYVRIRNKVPVSVYKGEGVFLRIGPKDLIEKEVEYHERLSHYGFPIAEILGKGEYENESYFIERSLGDFHFGQLFAEDFVKKEFVSDVMFKKFLALTKEYAEAQFKTALPEEYNQKDFEKLIQFETVLSEAPYLMEKSKTSMRKVHAHVVELPIVMSHCDFNPSNIFERGVIDWERASLAPLGYDIVTNISQIFFFPHRGEYEYMGKYVFSKEQVYLYWREMDALYESQGLPKISLYVNDFIFCRAVWSVVRMEKTPKIQKWRYDQYEKLIDAYLRGDDLMEFLIIYQ